MPHQSLNNRGDVSKHHVGLPGELKDVNLTRQLSLTKHHSPITRKEVLIYIEQHLPSNPSSYNGILNSITPLIIDQSQSVRATLVSLLNSIGEKHPGFIELHARSLVLFIHSAMTHIQVPIRNDSTKFLQVLIDYGHESLVKSSFVKTLRAFCQILNWQLDVDSKKSLSLAVSTSSLVGGSAKLARVSHLKVLHKFLNAGVFTAESNGEEEVYDAIHPLTSVYMIPTVPQPYAHLKLFVNEMTSNIVTTSQNVDLNSINTEDVETRRRALVEYFGKPISKGLNDFIKEGGEVGQELKSVLVTLERAIKEDQEVAE